MAEHGLPLPIDPEAIIKRFYPAGSLTGKLLLRHGELVAGKALDVLEKAPWMGVDRAFVVQAAMLHDIGIGRTRCPQLGCTGDRPYVCHGVQGRVMLDGLGFRRHGLVCERHVGVGIRKCEVLRRNLPLPPRDMLPVTLEERLICYADKFFSKADQGGRAKTIPEITAGLERHGECHVHRFLALHHLFTRKPTNPPA